MGEGDEVNGDDLGYRSAAVFGIGWRGLTAALV